MTKAALLRALEPFGDDQYVIVRLHSRDYPYGCQLGIYGVEDMPPWHGSTLDRSNYLICIDADAENSDIRVARARKMRAEAKEARS